VGQGSAAAIALGERAYPNFLRNRRLESRHDGYACVNDMAQNYGFVTVYVSERRQRAVLEDLGYEVLRTMAPDLAKIGGVLNYVVCRGKGNSASSLWVAGASG
jgi:hypothetical protein